jgi:hypothetical protein
VDATTFDAAGKIYLSTTGNFSVSSVSGADEDVFVFTPTTLGPTTAGSYSSTLFFDGSLLGLAANDVTGIDLPLGTAAAGAQATSAAILDIARDWSTPAGEKAAIKSNATLLARDQVLATFAPRLSYTPAKSPLQQSLLTKAINPVSKTNYSSAPNDGESPSYDSNDYSLAIDADDNWETTLRTLANDVYSAIIDAGDI